MSSPGVSEGGEEAPRPAADLESMRQLRLDEGDREELLEEQQECTFVFGNEQGWPSGVVMNYLRKDGLFWLTAVEGRAHVRALALEPRVTIVVSSAGTSLPGRRMVAIRGRAVVHRGAGTRDEMLDACAHRWRPEDPERFRRALDTPGRVMIEVEPVAIAVSHDHRKIARE